MKKTDSTDPGAISLLLYSMQFSPNRDMPEWSSEQTKHFLKFYGKEKLIYITENIQHYFSKKDINLDEILPSMSATIEEKELFLIYAYNGLTTTGAL